MRFFHKKTEYCSICGINLKFKYKPAKTWQIQGNLCGDCHTTKMKEYYDKQAEAKRLEEIKENHCSICGKLNETTKKRPRWQWNMEAETVLCVECFDKREQEYKIRLDFCNNCNGKLGIIRYNPKTNWKVNGQLCRRCWDNFNKKYEFK